jgi:hypothetical protein
MAESVSAADRKLNILGQNFSESKVYEQDASVACGGKTYPIPTYFPYMDLYAKEGIYLAADCDNSSLNVYLGLSEGCKGENICGIASFSFNIVNDRLTSILDTAFTKTAKKIVFDGTQEGYFLPSICYTYCNEMYIVWFDGLHAYIIGSKTSKSFDEDAKELKKSIESYVSNPLYGEKP